MERAGEQCTNWAMKGQKVCAKHGGRAPQNVRAAERRLAEEAVMTQARKMLRSIEIEPVDNPLQELAHHAGEVRALRDYLRGEVNRLDALRYQGASGEQIRGELAAYQSALRDTTNVLALYAKLNIDQRLVQIEEAKADIVIKAIEAALAYAGVTGQKAVEAKRVAARHLHAI